MLLHSLSPGLWVSLGRILNHPKLIERSGRDLRVAARTLREDGPEVLGTLRG